MSGFEALERRLDVGRVMDIVADAAKGAVEESAEAQKEYIRGESGTGNTWVANWDNMPNAMPGRKASIPGRNASGALVNAVEGRVIREGNRVIGEVGWLEDIPKYASFQEHGGSHNIIDSLFVSGMHSLRVAEESLGREANLMADEIARRL